MATQTKDTPNYAEIPEGLPTELREALQRVYYHLRGPTHTSQGGTRHSEYRQTVNDGDELEFGVWRNRSFERVMRVSAAGDVRPAGGLLVTSPNGTVYRVTVTDAGVLGTEAV